MASLGTEGRFFFAHIHKASGTSFIQFMNKQAGLVDCEREGLTSIDHVHIGMLDGFHAWWNGSRKDCNWASTEIVQPGLSTMVHQFGGGTASPALVTFLRHPSARCRSAWAYDHRICSPPQSFSWKYCHSWFLPRYGNRTQPIRERHRQFVKEKCADFMTKRLAIAGRRDDAATVLQRLQFVGVTEYFEESLCLFLHIVGRFPHDLCTCPKAGGGLRIDAHVIPQLRSRNESASNVSLYVSDVDLARHNIRDMALHEAALSRLKLRVQMLESKLNARIWDCRA
jgi:hypothetical protein